MDHQRRTYTWLFFPKERGKFGIVREHSRKISFGREHFEEEFSSRALCKYNTEKNWFRPVTGARCAPPSVTKSEPTTRC